MIRQRGKGGKWYMKGVRVVSGMWEGEGGKWYVKGVRVVVVCRRVRVVTGMWEG